MADFSHRFYKKHLSEPIIGWLATTNIQPWQVTVFNLIFSLIGACYFFALGTYWGNLIALVICGYNVILDYVDGDLARKTNRSSEAGIWLDVAGDVILRYAIVAAISYGSLRACPLKVQSSQFVAALLLLVSMGASNMLAVYYNTCFGFDSYNGNEGFRGSMDAKPTLLNRVLKNIIDPTSSTIGLGLFTVRYYIVIGALLNILLPMMLLFTIFLTAQWIILFVLFVLHLLEYKGLWALQVLSLMDKERQEYYEQRRLMA